MNPTRKTQGLSVWLSQEAHRRLDERAAAAAAAAGVPVARATLGAALLHGALGLRPDGSEHPAEEAAPAVSADIAGTSSLLPDGSDVRANNGGGVVNVSAAEPPAEVERPAEGGPPPRARRLEKPATVAAGFSTLVRFTDPAERRRVVAGYMRELQERCGVSEEEARAVLRAPGNSGSRPRLRVTHADFEP